MGDRGLVVSGPPGVGKTTVAWRVFDSLTDSGDAPGFIDLDLMGAAWPAPDDDPHQARLKARNAAAVWASYESGGSRLLVVAGLIETTADRELLSQALAIPVTVCRLTSSADVLARRIRERGRDHGLGLEKLIHRAAELQAQLARDDIADFVIETTNRSVEDVALEVIIQWRGSTHAHPAR